MKIFPPGSKAKKRAHVLEKEGTCSPSPGASEAPLQDCCSRGWPPSRAAPPRGCQGVFSPASLAQQGAVPANPGGGHTPDGADIPPPGTSGVLSPSRSPGRIVAIAAVEAPPVWHVVPELGFGAVPSRVPAGSVFPAGRAARSLPGETSAYRGFAQSRLGFFFGDFRRRVPVGPRLARFFSSEGRL